MNFDNELSENQKSCRQALSCWFLTGATAVGKTAVSVELARRLNAEICLLDSMTVYRGMDIGTAKPGPEVRREVPHHLIDICDPVESFSVSMYRHEALRKIGEIQSRGKQVLFVGGSALYLKAMLRGLFDGPPADWDFRRAIEAEAEEVGIEELHRRLQVFDPLTAHRLHVNDRRRIIRALEVFRTTGKPLSHWQMEFDVSTPPDACRVFCLRRPRESLHDRIQQRVNHMFETGIVDEVEGLISKWQELGHTASQAVGYCEVIAYLAGQMDLATTMERVLIRTRRFARHQETWFRGMEECRILDIDDESSASSIADQLIDLGMNQTVLMGGP